MKKIICLLAFSLLGFKGYSQEMHKRIAAIEVHEEIRIDGILDEPAWKLAPVAGEFTQRDPYNGRPATYQSEVRFLFDNTGVYVGATMFDPYPDSIPSQMGLRDATNLNADNFVVVLSPFNDGINAFCFLVYVSDVQADFKLPGPYGDDDFTWDAVWKSKARKTSEGWIAEFKIPYSAVRFPKKEVQEWGVNCQRLLRRTREVTSWNPVDNKISGYVNQCGILDGIRDIKPPLRLSVTPYVSGYMQNTPDDKTYNFTYNYGADLKYGLNQSFTLDMTLIPDFGQVKSDDKVYNFSPFEIQYAERRQFFTEGTELFNKGGIFYTRRIGNQPKGYDAVAQKLNENEIISENPQSTRLINATKISGRTPGGLGIGFFNAMSANTYAKVRDTVTGQERKIMTQGFTNYNTFILDQNLRNNSYIDFLNTNYYIPDEGYMANVTGTSFKFANKPYTYAFTGEAFASQKYYRHGSNDFGFRSQLSFGKISGKFRFDYTQTLETDSYDPNDMGFNIRNNLFENDLSFQYNLYDPFGKFKSMYNWFMISYNALFNDLKYTSFSLEGSSHLTTLKHLDFGANTEIQPVESHDYYEPRVDGWMYISPAYGTLNFWISTDYRKKFAFDAGIAGYIANANRATGYNPWISPRYRVSDRIMLIYRCDLERILNDVGYVTDYIESGKTVIIFGRRDRTTISNVLEASYILRSNMSVDLRGRYYWVNAPYYSYYQLNNNGRLDPAEYQGDPSVNYNLFNLDLTYIWNFAPGSQISVMWKNVIDTFNHDITPGFFENLGNTMKAPSANSFSVRFLYYLDALYLKRSGKKV
jgi:hypothetical protein